MKPSLSYKGHGKSVFVIFGGRVREASVIGTNSNNRGIVVGNRLMVPALEIDELGGPSLPLTTDFQKRDIFKDEEVANKALFTRKLKGEIK